jgi:hypothetical protein
MNVVVAGAAGFGAVAFAVCDFFERAGFTARAVFTVEAAVVADRLQHMIGAVHGAVADAVVGVSLSHARALVVIEPASAVAANAAARTKGRRGANGDVMASVLSA